MPVSSPVAYELHDCIIKDLLRGVAFRRGFEVERVLRAAAVVERKFQPLEELCLMDG